VKQSANKCTFAIVNAAAGEQAQQFLAFVLRKICVDIGTNEI
jgi:hypothetical protein